MPTPAPAPLPLTQIEFQIADSTTYPCPTIQAITP